MPAPLRGAVCLRVSQPLTRPGQAAATTSTADSRVPSQVHPFSPMASPFQPRPPCVPTAPHARPSLRPQGHLWQRGDKRNAGQGRKPPLTSSSAQEWGELYPKNCTEKYHPPTTTPPTRALWGAAMLSDLSSARPGSERGPGTSSGQARPEGDRALGRDLSSHLRLPLTHTCRHGDPAPGTV